MMYHIYSETKLNDDKTKGIYHFTVYEENKFELFYDCRIIPIESSFEFSTIPFCAAIQRIRQKYRLSRTLDSIKIMTKDPTVSSIINRREYLYWCPLVSKYLENEFKHIKKIITAHIILSDFNYYNMFEKDPNDLQRKEMRYLNRYIHLLDRNN